MRAQSLTQLIVMLVGLSALPACAARVQSTSSDTAPDGEAALFAEAVRWVKQQETTPIRLDPRPMPPRWDASDEGPLLAAADPEVTRLRTAVLAQIGITQTDGVQALGCVGTGGLRANPSGPIAEHCAALDDHRAVLISLPWAESGTTNQTVRVLVLSNFGVDVYDLTATGQREGGWRIIRSAHVEDVKS